MSAANLEFRVGADKSALIHRETAKEARSTSSCSFAPWGEGKDEGFHERRNVMTSPLTLALSPGGEGKQTTFALGEKESKLPSLQGDKE